MERGCSRHPIEGANTTCARKLPSTRSHQAVLASEGKPRDAILSYLHGFMVRPSASSEQSVILNAKKMALSLEVALGEFGAYIPMEAVASVKGLITKLNVIQNERGQNGAGAVDGAGAGTGAGSADTPLATLEDGSPLPPGTVFVIKGTCRVKVHAGPPPRCAACLSRGTGSSAPSLLWEVGGFVVR